MKRNYIFCLLLCLVSSFAYCQKIELSESKLKEVLCKTWILDHGMANDEEIQGLELFTGEVFEFKTNNTYNIKSKSGNTTGIWKFNEEDKCIEIFTDDRISSRIKFINTEKLILLPELDKMQQEFIKNLEFHFKILK